MIDLRGYQLSEKLYEGTRTRVYRGIRSQDGQSVVIKVLHQDYPSFNDLLQFRHQYAISKNLEIPGIVRPYSLETYGNSYALVMEDFGGISLKNYSQTQQPPMTEVLAIAIQLCDILHHLHQNRIIHKDIKPANILIHPESKQVKLLDFSIASLLPKETQEIKNPNVLEGTLAYIAPEQTGRMNRGIDYRADFYALGVTLFELLTGKLPFPSPDPMELVHCHIAKMPPSIGREDIPQVISDIVTKLMAKNAEDRYQSALGLKSDLEICLDRLKETETIESFEIGTRDLGDRFIIPEKLYGREREVEALLQAFARVAEMPENALNFKSEMMLVSGFSGIGKTAVIHEVHKPITRQNGYFIKGKFDQFNRNIPLSAFVQALRDLIGQLLSESEKQLHQWRTQILEAIGENGRVLIEVIPELERIVGKKPPAPELSGTAAQNRFNLLFQNFIAVFATAEHPLVIFLDDLQWADSASLQLMKLLMEEKGSLLLLGAYRDNEVSPVHPFMLAVEELKKTGKTVNSIILEPLEFNDTNRLVAETLNCPLDRSQPLTELIDRKTRGNPFFTTQFLKALYEDGHIAFNHDRGYWECDLTQVNTLSLTDNVVEFMAQQLQKLPRETQEILKLAACIGNSFELETLGIVSEQSPTQIATALWKALQEGSILPVSQTYKFFHPASIDLANSETPIDLGYRFVHDRIQQAAYSLISDDRKPETHLKIGRLLLENASPDEREDNIFTIVNQLNIGRRLLNQEADKKQLLQLNLIAARKAKLSTAYVSASGYVEIGIELLPKDSWQSQIEFTKTIYELAAEVAYLSTNYDRMEQLADIFLFHADCLIEKVRIYELKMLAIKAQGQLLKSIQIGLQLLELLGIKFPTEPTPADVEKALEQTAQLWQNSDISSLLDAPVMTDSAKLAAMQILTQMVASAYQAASLLMPLLIFKQIELSILEGHCEVSPFSYADYGLVLGGVVGDLDSGYQFGKLAVKLLDRFNPKAAKCRTYFIVNSYINHWKEPLSRLLPFFLEAYQAGLETGDLECSALNAQTYCAYAYFSGCELTTLAVEMENYRQAILQLKQESSLNYHAIYHQTVLNFLGRSENPCQLTGEIYAEARAIPGLQQANNRSALCYLYYNKTVLYYLFGEYQQAADCAALVESYADGMVGMFVIPLFYLYSSLVDLALFLSSSETNQKSTLEKVGTYQNKLKYWADNAPENHLHKFNLVAAEWHRVLGNKADAIEYYDRAIAGAKENGYIQEEALANELAAKFYLDWGKEKVAAGYLQEAYYGYAQWGAKAKTDHLEKCYPDLLRPILQQAANNLGSLETLVTIAASSLSIHNSNQTQRSSSTSINTALDFASAVKASQILSKTIHLDELLHQLAQIILQHSGGERCALILPDIEGNWQVKAMATLEEIQLCSEPLEGNSQLPVKLIQYVKNTQEAVVIDNLQTDLPVIDEYLSQRKPKSVLCLPIINQGHLIGILYLKNRSTPGVFTNDRILILNFLCTQAAISLENARLYRESQAYAQQLERSMEKLRISEARFQKLADNVPGLIYQICIKADGSSSMPFVSSGCQMLYGVRAEEVMSGKYTLRDFEHPDDRESLMQAVAESARHLTPFQHEWRIVTPNGDVKWVKAAAQPERREDGDLVWDGMLIDITDRKYIEAEQKRLLAILENTLDWVGIADPTGKPLYVNRAWRDLIDLEDGETIKESNIAQYHPQWAFEIVANQGLPAAARSGTWVGETAVLDRCGREIPVSQVLLAHKSSNGEVEYFSTILRDISEIKAAETQLQQKTQELEQALQELKETQLQIIQSEKMSALGNLVAGVAHEINNPIGFIGGNLQPARDYVRDLFGLLDLYQEKYPEPEAEIEDEIDAIDLDYIREDLPKLIDSMKLGVERIGQISTSLRTFSRTDKEYKVPFNLHEGIDSTLLILKHRLKANENRPAIEIVKNYGNLPEVDCFPGQLNQVFMNILANAIDALDEFNEGRTFEEIRANPNRITLQTEQINDRIVVRIRDNGKGIPEAVKDQIFEQGFTTKGVGKGTGLGLAIARQIIAEKHGGILEVASIPGKGTEFTIALDLQSSNTRSPSPKCVPYQEKTLETA